MKTENEATRDGVEHPIQPLVMTESGVVRFKENAIVSYLLANGGITMNDLAVEDFTREDREQFAQLIGYSHSGSGDLPYMSDAVWYAAQSEYERRLASRPQPAAGEAALPEPVNLYNDEMGNPACSGYTEAQLIAYGDARAAAAKNPAAEAIEYHNAVGPIDAMYAAFSAMENNDTEIEQWPQRAIDALAFASWAVVPYVLPYEVLGEAGMSGTVGTGLSPRRASGRMVRPQQSRDMGARDCRLRMPCSTARARWSTGAGIPRTGSMSLRSATFTRLTATIRTALRTTANFCMTTQRRQRICANYWNRSDGRRAGTAGEWRFCVSVF
jgi:hypothetical protein